VKNTMAKARSPVNAAMDWVIHQAVKLVKAAGKFLAGVFGGKKDKKEDKAESGSPEQDAKLEGVLAAIDKSEAAHEKEGGISREDAEKVAAEVKAANPAVKSISVVDGDKTWDYEVSVNPKARKRGGFKGASERVKKGIKQLRDLIAKLEAKDVYQAFTHGINAQLTRAEQLHQTGRLAGVEVRFEADAGAIDMELKDPSELVEYKYWTRKHYKEKMKELSKQLKKYVRTGKPVVLEMGVTKTDPIDVAFVETTLLSGLERRGLTYEGLINIYEHENMISVSVVAKKVP
jgi:hypothetical protein